MHWLCDELPQQRSRCSSLLQGNFFCTRPFCVIDSTLCNQKANGRRKRVENDYFAKAIKVPECILLHHVLQQPKQVLVCLPKHKEHGEHPREKKVQNEAFVRGEED